jgi:hypothetical protein
VAQVRVPRKGVTQRELATVLSLRLGGGYEIRSNGDGEVTVRRGSLSTAVIRIRDVYRLGTARRVTEALRRSPEFRSV